MKKLTIALVAMIGLSGCGMVSDNCDGDICHALFGAKDSEQDERLDAVESKIRELELDSNYLKVLIEIYKEQNEQALLQLQVLLQQQETANNVILQNQISIVQANLDDIEMDVYQANLNIASNTADIYTLQNNVQVVEIVDPCTTVPNVFNEVLLRTSQGIIASFSDNANGKNTRFSLLRPGTYQTTDGTNCSFTVGPNLSVTPSVVL